MEQPPAAGEPQRRMMRPSMRKALIPVVLLFAFAQVGANDCAESGEKLDKAQDKVEKATNDLEAAQKKNPVGDFSHCQKVVGSWVFFTAHNAPFNAANREIVDGYCKAASPEDSVDVVGDAAYSEIQGG